MRSAFALAIASVPLLLLGGSCMPPTTTAGEQVGNNPNAGSGSLTAPETSLAQMLARKQVRLMQAMGAIALLASPGVIPTSDGIVQTGICPQIVGERQGNAVALQLNYGSGCTTDQYAAGIYSGTVTVAINLATGAFTAPYSSLAVNGDPIAGFIGPAIWTTHGNSSVLEGSVAFDDEDTNSNAEIGIVGTVDVTFTPASGNIVISDGDVALTENLDPTGAMLTGLVSNPQQNGNFIPQSGTAATAAHSPSAVVTFNATSPAQRTASVSINGAPAIAFDLE